MIRFSLDFVLFLIEKKVTLKNKRFVVWNEKSIRCSQANYEPSELKNVLKTKNNQISRRQKNGNLLMLFTNEIKTNKFTEKK